MSMIDFLRKPRGRQTLTNTLETERHSNETLNTQGRTASTTSASFVDQKIHPDLNALVEALSSSSAVDPATPSRSDSRPAHILQISPLHPRSRSRLTDSRDAAKRPHIRTSDLSGITPDQSSASIATPLSANDSRQWSPMIKGSSIDLPPSSPRNVSILADLPVHEEQSWWSTFGKTRLRALSYGSDAALNFNNDKQQTMDDSLYPTDQDESWHTALSYYTNYDAQTPRSRSQSFCCSTPHSRSRSYQSTTRSASPPNTFGVRSPPRSGTSLKYDHRHRNQASVETHFGFREPPPPLPPLDHPAFHDQAGTEAERHQNTFPKSTGKPRDELSKFVHTHHSARNSHSLSSLQRLKKDSLPVTTAADPSARRHQSGPLDRYAETDVVESDAAAESPSKKASHSRMRLLGKKSKSNGRRRSAEFSAKQAASVGYDPMLQECWEVQVSREMVRLALGNSQGMADPGMLLHDGASVSGKARGHNRFPGAVSDLGPPITLPDTPRSPPPKLNVPLSNDFSQLEFNTETFSRYLFPDSITSRDDMADDSADIIPVTTSTRTSSRARRAQDTSMDDSPPSSPGSVSRKGGGRAISSPSRTRTPSSKPRVDTASFFSSITGSSSLLAAPTLNVIGATPEASPTSPGKRTHHKSSPTRPSPSVLKAPSTPPIMEKSYSSGSAKRKAEEAGVNGDKTPPKEPREHKTTFAPEPRTHRTSVSSAHAPSSYNRSKRVRLTDMSDTRTGSSRSASGTGTLVTPNDSPPNAKGTGSWSSRGSHSVSYASHPHSNSLHAPPAASGFHAPPHPPQAHRSPSRRSLSQASIPISALVSPHAPSVATSSQFHMRDPRKPPKIQPTSWTLSFPAAVRHDESRWARNSWVERGGSPMHAWFFFLGFVIFPLWWCAALMPVHKTRRLGGSDAEKGSVLLDDPQLEHDSRSWRTRCRVMSGVSLITYIPFIVLVAVFA